MAILPESVGYIIVLAVGLLFAALITLLTNAEKRYLGEIQTAEMFTSACRSVKTGLTASAIVSAWTWAATLLQSSTVAYKYGISGPFWYASGATVQVLLFAILAIQVKRRAPNAHTFLEIIRARYGKPAHLVFLFFGLLTNMIVTAMLLLGGSAVVSTLTGMNIIAAAFLIPVGVVAYTYHGGLKATFLSDYIHTVIIFLIILIFGFTVYATSPLIGSAPKMFDLLQLAKDSHPVDGNASGSYLTMSSQGGIIFGVINVVGNFGTVFVDQAYWQRAVAARPSSTVKSYLIGGLCWFTIPFFLATTLGLAGVALESNPSFPTFPNRIASADVNAGLTAPFAAVALMGSGGAVAILVLVFMAVTSAASAELTAVSSIITFDVYRTYINPKADSLQIVRASHYSIAAFGLIMAILAVILHAIGISLGYLYELMGTLVSCAVFPIAFTITWRKQTALGAICGTIVGLIAGVVSWLAVAKAQFGEITLDSTFGDYPMLTGNLVSLFASGIVTVAISMMKPDNFDWSKFDTLSRVEDAEDAKIEFSADETDPKKLEIAARFAYISSIVLTVVLLIVWPIPMYLSNYVFTSSFFTGWIVFGMLWTIIASVVIIFYPIIESRRGIMQIIYGILDDLQGKKPKMMHVDGEKTIVSYS
ncbi:Sodium:solute symporter family-domain-containing protein [Gorgonomyces haynaldii]|nr:Sodium:solute symporter family-domain-containing protein [Gorgonomyces haynaldii]